MCEARAKEYKFSELDNLWKQKWDFKKSVERTKKQEWVLARTKFCPKCGSSNINFLAFYRPSNWKCLNCDYEGALVVEDSKLAEKIEERYRKRRASLRKSRLKQ